MADRFVVHLGGGVYLDASGNVISGKPEGALAFPATEHGFHFKEFAEAAKELAELTGTDAEERFKFWGADKNVLHALTIIGGVTGAIAGMVGGIAVAMALMKVFGWLSGDDELSPAMVSALSLLRSQAAGAEEIARVDKLIELHSAVDGVFDEFKAKVSDLLVHQPTGAAKLALFEEMRAIVGKLSQPLNRLGNETWLSTYVADDYKARFTLSWDLRFGQPAGQAAGIGPTAPGVTRFDHRFGVPMLLYAATTFATMLRIATPWFRSSGTHAGQFRKLANAVDRFVTRMQTESLAHTEHTPQSLFNYDCTSSWLGFAPFLTQSLYPIASGNVYPVGAFDLVRYTDGFLAQKANEAFVAWGDTARLASFDFAWDAPQGGPQDVADAANAQAKRDYADLLVANGAPALVTIAGLLRFLSTPPDRSETVAGLARASRLLQSEEPTVARSPDFHFAGTVERPATLKKHRAHARLRGTTQEPGHQPAFRYRIVLRMIDSQFGKAAWQQRDYVGSIWRAEHEPLQGDPRNKRLRTTFSQGAVLDEIVLHEGISPAEPLLKASPRPVTMRAHTFDWYVPKLSLPWEIEVADIAQTQKAIALAAGGGTARHAGITGGVSIHLMQPSLKHGSLEHAAPMPAQALQAGASGDAVPMQTFGGSGPAPLDALVDIGSLPDIDLVLAQEMLDRGERRHVREETVTLEWQLAWKDGALDVIVSGRPEDRSFQAHIVVEEVVYSGEALPEDGALPLAVAALSERLHTPFAAEIVNQIVLVPKSFFDAEREAIQAEAKGVAELKRRWVISKKPQPGDPISDAALKARERLRHSASTAALVESFAIQLEAMREHEPELFREVMGSMEPRRGSTGETSSSTSA